MKILNTTTGQIENLLHSSYDCDCVPDLIASDDTITWTDDGDMKQGSEESIDWWRTFLTADAEFIAAKAELVAGLEHDQIAELEGLLNDAMGCDMEDQPAAGMQVLADFTNDVKAESQTQTKTYSVFNGEEEISLTSEGYWKESWGNKDEYDTLAELIEDLADHEKVQVEKEIEAQDSKGKMAIEKGSKVFVSEENQDGRVLSISSDEMFEVEFEDGEAGSYSRSEIEAL
jgi:hypothetical protein